MKKRGGVVVLTNKEAVEMVEFGLKWAAGRSSDPSMERKLKKFFFETDAKWVKAHKKIGKVKSITSLARTWTSAREILL